MFKKLKKTTMAAVTAAATLVGSGSAWALDIVYDGYPGLSGTSSTSFLPAEGCDGGNFFVDQRNFGVNRRMIWVLMKPGAGSTMPGFAGVLFDLSGNFDFAFGSFQPQMTTYCPNLTDLIEISTTPNITDEAVYASLNFVGTVFEATDTNDSRRYRFTIGFENESDSVAVWRRECVSGCDNDPPRVDLESSTTTLIGTDPFTVTATFNEDVTGFEEADVTVTNGSVVPGSLIGGPSVYTFLVEPTGNGDVTIIVPQNVVRDQPSQPVGNPNTASEPLIIGNRIVEVTQEQIAGFMLGRANNLASNQPGLTRFMRGEECGSFNASGTDAGGSLNGCASQGNVWSEITASWGNGSSYALGTIGAHQYINENFLLGGMVQFDRATDDRNNARGTGWMVGPYFAAKMAEQPLYFEGRLLYGQTKNKLTPIGTYTDSFETKRWLAQLRAEGEIQQETITWIPLLDFTHTRDRSKSYTDSLGNVIGSQSVALTQLTSGLDFRMPLQSDTGTLELTGGASAIYSSTKGGSADFENGRGRVHMGLNWDSGQGTTVRAGAFYDGIGARHRSVGGNLGVDIHF